jgi:hypothetical protein
MRTRRAHPRIECKALFVHEPTTGGSFQAHPVGHDTVSTSHTSGVTQCAVRGTISRSSRVKSCTLVFPIRPCEGGQPGAHANAPAHARACCPCPRGSSAARARHPPAPRSRARTCSSGPRAPGCVSAAALYGAGTARTPCAPSASALSMSLPVRTPPSKRSVSPLACTSLSAAMVASASRDAMAPSTCAGAVSGSFVGP